MWKTALMAKVAELLRAKDMTKEKLEDRRPIIIRFCGTSSGSSDGLSLVTSLCQQIQLVVLPRIEYPEPVPTAYDVSFVITKAYSDCVD